MSTKTFFSGALGFVAGGLAGALVALFSAPQSGQKTRALIRDKSEKLKDAAVERYEETREQAVQLADGLKEGIQSRTSKLLQVGQETLKKEKHLIEQSARKAQKALQA